MTLASAFAARIHPEAERILRPVIGEDVFDGLTREALGYEYIRRLRELDRSHALLDQPKLPDDIYLAEFRKYTDNLGMLIAILGALKEAE